MMIDKMTREQQQFANRHVHMMNKFIKNKISEGVIPHHLEDDFVSDTALRFCNSAVKFDYGWGFKFSTYAYGGFDMCYREIRNRKGLSYERNNFVEQEVIWNFLNSTPADTEHVEKEVLQDMIDKAKLSEREFMILQSYFFDSKSMAVVGEEYGVSRERISQIIKRIMEKLRRVISSEKLSLIDFYEH